MRRWAQRIGLISGLLGIVIALLNELPPIRWHHQAFQWWTAALWRNKVYHALNKLYSQRENPYDWSTDNSVLFIELSSSGQIRRWNTTRWIFPQNRPSFATAEPEILADEYTLYYCLKLITDTLRQAVLLPIQIQPGPLSTYERWDFPIYGDKKWIQSLCLRLSGEGLRITLPDHHGQPILRFYIGCAHNLRVPLRWVYVSLLGISLGVGLILLSGYLREKYPRASVVYLGVLVVTWLMLHWSGLPGRLIDSDFFSPTSCALSPLHTSLWDIAWNIGILFWLTEVLRQRTGSLPAWLSPIGYWAVWSIFGGALYLVSKHSQIEIDPLRELNLLQLAGWGIVLITLWRGISYFHLYTRGPLLLHGAIALASVLILRLIGLAEWGAISIGLLYLLPLSPRGLPVYLRHLIVFVLLAWSVNSWITWAQEARSRFLAEAYAPQVARLRDPSIEYRLSQILPRISADTLLWNSIKLEDYLIDARFIGNLIRRHLVTLGNDYDIVVSCWQKEGGRADNLFELRPLPWHQIKSRSVPIPFAPYLYFITQGSPRYIYVARLPIQIPEAPPLEVQIELYPRSRPLLGHLQAIEKLTMPEYGLYEQGYLIRWWGEEPFPSFLSLSSQSVPIWRQIGSKYEYIISVSPSLTVSLRLPARNWTAHLATIPIFLVLLSLGLLFERFSEIKSMVRALYTRNASFVQRFQVLLGVLVFLPLIVILIVTFFLFLRISENQRQQDLKQRLSTVSSYLSGETILMEKLAFWLQNYMAGEESFVRDLMRRIGSLSQSEAFIYTREGYLYSSTLPVAYWSSLVSPFIEPHILAKMQQTSSGPIIEVDKSRRRLMGYAPLRTETGKLLGILYIPQPLPKKVFYEPLWYFIGYTVNAYLFLSLSSIVVGLLLMERFSGRLQKVVMQLRSAPERPDPPILKWEGGKDEIATLVSAYNEMVERLQASQRQLERTLRRVSQQEMAFQAAHEIKTALTPLKIHLQHLQRLPNVDPEKLREISTRLLQRIDSLVRIANAFMSFAKLGSAEELPLQPIHLNAALEEMLQPFIQNPHVALDVQLPAEPLWIEGNLDALQQVLNNLIQNALQALEGTPAPRIQVALFREGNDAVISVQDNGPGIPVEVRERIFEFYFTTRRSGTGLGLAITKGLVERMGGRISFTTEVEQGTTFYVTFPLRPRNGIQNETPTFGGNV